MLPDMSHAFRRAAPSGPSPHHAQAPKTPGYRPPKTRWHALLDRSIGLAFWGAMFVLFARYIGVMR